MSINGETATEPISELEQRLKALEHQVSSLATEQLCLAEGSDELERQVRQRTASLQALNQELAIELAKSKITLEQNKQEEIALLESSSISSTEDISERKLLAQENARLTALLDSSGVEIIRLNRCKDDFMSTISHELRAPFNPILGTLDAIQQRSQGPITEWQERSLVLIVDRVKHLLRLIDKILAVASDTAVHPEELPISNIETAKFCQARFAAVREEAKRKGLRLITNIMPNATEIAIDEVRIRQVVDELLDNAVKFNKSGGSVSLDVYLEQCSNPSICLSISDNGIGIATEDFDKLFQPFSQLSSGLSRRYNGMGFGLTLVKQLVEQHGGTVEFRSKLDEGSCFLVRLPLRTSPVR
jgi:signal transduction histidine kinase